MMKVFQVKVQDRELALWAPEGHEECPCALQIRHEGGREEWNFISKNPQEAVLQVVRLVRNGGSVRSYGDSPKNLRR